MEEIMKKWFKKAAGLCLAMGMAVGLCACGSGGKMENAGLAKEGVYKFQEFTMPELGGDGYNLSNTFHSGGMVYLMAEVYHWSEGGQTDIRLISMKEDGTDIQVNSLEIPVKDNTNGGGGAVPMPMPRAAVSTTDVPAVEDNMSNVWEYDNYFNYTIAPDGTIYGIHQHQYEKYGVDSYESKQTYYLAAWNQEGKMQWEKELEGLQTEDEYIYVNAVNVAQDGTVYLMLTGDNVYKMTVDAQGNISDRKPLPEEAGTLFTNLNQLISKPDGTFLAVYYDESDMAKQYIVSYDPATDALGTPGEMPSSLLWGGYNILIPGTNSDLIYTNNNGVYTYNVGDADSTQRMSYVNSDLNITNMSGLVELDADSFIGIFFENYDNEIKAGLFTHVDPKDIPDKAVLVLAGNYVNNDIKKRVIQYNRASEEYRIVIKDYESYNNYDDYQAGLKQLNNDITTGNMPDILIAQGLPTANYAAKGWLADIGKLIKEDEELSQVEFVQSVFDAYSVNGKLHYVIPSFTVRTMLAKTSIVGDRSSWTMEEAQQLVASMPEKTSLIGETTRDDFFNVMMDFCASDFIDVSTGKCDFNSPNFIKMMEYAKSLPVELGEDYYGEDYWMNYQTQYRDNRTILCSASIADVSNMNYTINGRIGEDVSYIGFPTESGAGSYVNATESYAISARSKNIEGAWEFVRYYLTEEYQTADSRWGLPIQMKYFKENAQKALNKPFYLDQDGNKVEYEDTFYLNGEQIPLPQLTQTQIDKMVDFIFSVKKCQYNNQEVMNIINEEMAAFYSGQKSAEETAKIIQSRAQIYVDENR